MSFTAIITGGSRGIGFAIAKQFALLGWKLILVARDSGKLAKAKAELIELGAESVEVISADLSNKDQVLDCAQMLVSKLSHLDLLVNNAGVFLPGTMMEESDDQFDLLWNTNVSGVYLLTKKLWPLLKKSPRAHVINMCSIASITAYSAGGTYSLTKFALLGFSKSLREEGKNVGIRVSSILPGATYTDSWNGVELPESRFMQAASVAKACKMAFEINEDTVMEEIVLRPILGDL